MIHRLTELYLAIYIFISSLPVCRDQIWTPLGLSWAPILVEMKQEAFQGSRFSSIVRKKALSCVHNERPFLLLFSTRE